ncbi:MAG: Ig-like domain-containing protein [Clostridia bacterium]|nr:Ig-like domain-containing protein [Clostridia bacterium]
MKKLISFLLALVMFLCAMPFQMNAETAAPVKDGFTLVPTLYGKTGIDVLSAFVLTTPEAITLEELNVALSIDGQPTPDVAQKSEKEFLITPSATLSYNSLYLFRLQREGKADVTWAFQTTAKFQITSSYPSNQATNVPKNTGIEITFSSEGYSAIDEFFSISPQVEGRFETHKNTAVFVPKSLDYATVYTVTLKAGIKLEGTNETIATDHVFAFETEPAPKYKPPENSERFHFFTRYAELPTIEPPTMSFRIDSSFRFFLPNPTISVYKFNSNEQAIETIRKMTGAPRWSRYAREEYLISTSDLNQVMSFGAKDTYDANRYSLSLPDSLSQGFYLIEATLGDSCDQMIVQITDLPVQVIAASNQTIIWANDLITGEPAPGATVYDQKEGKTYSTDADGVAVIGRALQNDHSEGLTITALDGKTCVWLHTPSYDYYYFGGYWFDGGNENEAYWTALQLDRTLFKRDDTVSFFGFAQDRKNEETIQHVSVVLTQGYGYRHGFYGPRDILYQQTVPVQNGIYAGEIRLPNLDAGPYCLTVYHGQVALSSTYFTVQEYVKPPYKIEVTADQKAVFVGDSVTFTAKAGFFEGTPVSDLDVSYQLWSYRLLASGNGQGKTNLDGEIEVSQKIAPQVDAQGEGSLTFTAEATLPEMGRTTQSVSVRGFINDIDVNIQAQRTNENATLTVDVHSITLDRINDGTARHYHDYLDEPVAEKSLSVAVYRVYYVKVQAGEYYDYIEKKNRPRYRYNRMEELIERFDIVTDPDGTATRSFTVPNRKDESYFAEITNVDGNGRAMSQRIYIGRDYSSYYYYANSNDYYLDGANDGYAIGQEVNLTLKRGTDTVENGNVLFITMQRGIHGYQAGKTPYIFTFGEEHIPNVTVNAYYFNGFTYQSSYNMSAYICFDYAANDLTVTAVTDKDVYQPGDICTITITAKDKDGNPKEATVNISMVDEALFALQDYHVNTLASLYRGLSSGLRFATSTHRTYEGVMLGLDEAEAPLAMADNSSPSATSAPGMGGGDETYIREVFKDTAYFSTLRTNELGQAVYTFQLPDNITSWRLTMSGISNDLYAGNGVQNILVTNPMFLSYTLNNTFLIGDVPTLGVNAYGTSLTGGETVEFAVWDENAPDQKYTAGGVAFERVNIPLWQMDTEGAHTLVIQATVNNGKSDAVKHAYQVFQTYRQIDTATYYDVTTDTVFDVGVGGLTQITFTDRSQGQYLWQLLGMGYVYGDRIEKLLVRREANKMIAEYFPDFVLYAMNESFDPKPYQRHDGGIAILPHADSDLETTVKLLPYIQNEININALKNYLYNIYEGDNANNKMCALYGLAMLKEPVLLDLDGYATLDGLPVKDIVYIALGYDALGETGAASALYDSRIAPNLEQITPYYRVNTGVDHDDILEATSAANLLAAKLNKPEREGLYQYCIQNRTTDILINVEKLAYIRHEIDKRTETSGSITYTLFGQAYTRELENGCSYTLSIPAQNISELVLLEVTGDVGAVSAYKIPMTEMGHMDPDIIVNRRYYKANGKESGHVFEQGDLIRVELWIDYSAKAIQGAYCVTDYLPSGLEYVSGSAKVDGTNDIGYGYFRYAKVEGQKIMFYDYNRRFNKGYLYYYYARVISPGTFKAEGALVQNLNAKDSFAVGDDSVMVIN